MGIITLTKNNFDEVIEKAEFAVLDFWAEWCGPCKAFSPIFIDAAETYPDILFAKINIEEEPELAADFNIRSIPLLMILRENIAVFSRAGLLSAAALHDLIEQARNIDMNKARQQIKAQQSD